MGFGIWDLRFGIWDLGFGIYDLGIGYVTTQLSAKFGKSWKNYIPIAIRSVVSD